MMFFSKRSSIQAGISVSGSRPVEGALLNNPNVSDDQNTEKHEHLDQTEQRELFVNDCPGKQEHSFHIENDKQNRDDVVTDRIAFAGIRLRIHTALVRRQLPFPTRIGAYEFRRQQRNDRERKRDGYEQKDRNVCE